MRRPGSEGTHGWGAQPNASWLSNCLVEDAGLQPGVPLFAIGCNDPDNYDFGGHIVVFDANTGAVLTSTHLDNLSVGFEGGYNIKFDAERTQLATNSGTSGIAAIDRNGGFIGQAFPDETRDHAMDYTWVDHRIFTDTSDIFEIKRGDRRFDFEPSGPPWFVTSGSESCCSLMTARLRGRFRRLVATTGWTFPPAAIESRTLRMSSS